MITLVAGYFRHYPTQFDPPIWARGALGSACLLPSGGGGGALCVPSRRLCWCIIMGGRPPLITLHFIIRGRNYAIGLINLYKLHIVLYEFDQCLENHRCSWTVKFAPLKHIKIWLPFKLPS